MKMKRVVAAVVCASALAGPLRAQEPVPIQELIDQANEALNGLRYTRAATIARTLLETGQEGHADVEIVALQLLAAALYPEETRMQRLESATGYLRRLVWTGPDASIPRSMSWPGLDSLLERTRRESFVVYAEPEPRYLLKGLDAPMAVPVQTTRPATVHLMAAPRPAGEPFALDSLRVDGRGVLRPGLFAGDRPRLPSGDYELRVIAVDDATGAAFERSYAMTVEAPSLELLPAPPPLASDALLPERTVRRPGRNALIGLGLGVATGVVAAALRADAPANVGAPDRRAFVIGGSMSVAAIVGAVLDRGRPLPANVARNRRLEDDHRAEVARVAQENARRRANLLTTVVVGPERR